MAIENFEGKNIQDTFQRVVQTDGTNRLADGTGSIFIPVSSSHAITASHALFAVSASHEVTFELSSSHAVSADTASFATNFTASGNISASGHISSSGLYVESSTITDFIKLNSLGSSANPIKLIFEKSVAEQGIIEYNRNGDLELYNSDNNGGVMIDGSTSAGGDFYVANSGKVGIGTTSPGEQLEVVGNISASGTISASRFNGSGGDLVDVSYNNLSFVPSGIISGAAQINNLDLTINGGTF